MFLPKNTGITGFAAALALLLAAPSSQGVSKNEPTFERDIRPILKTHCFHCHGEEEKPKAGLDVRLKRFILQGSKDGPVLVPGKRKDSELYRAVLSGDMPEGEKKLTAVQIELIGKWIDKGAKTLRAEPEKLDANYFTEEERSHWAYQPLAQPAVPKVSSRKFKIQNPIDAFVAEKLQDNRLTFSPEADKATLIRRATFDLTGLPPTPAEVDAFLTDTAPDAYERLIDRLLASPHYGERWGRHWLDVAGYADSEGITPTDAVRKYAWKYRDYVINSLNEDKPFNQFIVEQMAGDEMVKPPYKNLSPADLEKLTATGYLRMAPDPTGSGAPDQKLARNQVVTDTVKIVSTSLLGMTVGCAECHDHKHDAIPQSDFYRMRAIFEPAYDWKNWKTPNARLISLMTDDERAEAAKVEVEAKKLDAERLKKQDEFITEILEQELAKKEEGLREPLRTAYRTVAAKRTPEQVKLLKAHPTVMNLTPGSLYLYEQKKADELKKMADEAAKVRAQKPKEDFVSALTEPGGKLPVTQIFYRGDVDQPKAAVKPGDLMVLASLRKVELPDNDEALTSSGRRLAFAQELTDGHHPLTTRVLVNRIWLHHFGRGLVNTPGDFGTHGETPSHPELLDWLANEFVKEGWSAKKLHKLIMTSTTYRQASTRDAKKERVDGENRLLWRMNVKRLEAEEIRDSLLAVSGKLNPKMYGEPVPIKEDESGQVVVGIDTNDDAGRPSGKVIPMDGEEFRRSLYIQVRRSKPVGLLETFDVPSMEPNCTQRNASTVAPQSLALMNGEFTLEQAKSFAERVEKEAGAELDAQVEQAWKIAFAESPSMAEVMKAKAFLDKQSQHFAANPPPQPTPAKGKTAPPAPTAQHLALESFCQVLISANRFLYVD